MDPKHILVIRISAMGDTAMTVPVLQQLLQQYPFLYITVVTDEYLTPFFETLERITVIPIETKGKHKGFFGLHRFYRQLKKQDRFHAIADLHDSLRSKILRSFFFFQRIPKAVIDKGRREKRHLARKKHKKLLQLKSSFQRYADVFAALGFPIELNVTSRVFSKQLIPAGAETLFVQGKTHIAIAPFAKHKEKTYPLEKMKAVVKDLASHHQLQVFLLGNETDEAAALSLWEKEFPGVTNLAGQFNFREQIALISNMDAVISMDSANMHIASLFGVPVLSIWGATHPFAGFYGWGQSENNVIQIDLYCRPCSVFGNKPCYRGDHACMVRIKKEAILEGLNSLIR
ncbi:MAG TPA: glycosyltransferase family 9 protein [Chitinophagaceae bacterium]|nr:glycosyltransferase family 9 protein [Chitinophagaceae bacterium]